MLDRKTAPKHAAINSFQLPAPEIKALDNGVPLFVLRGVSQQVLKLELVFSGGKWDESKNGLSYFTAHMLEKGTRDKNSFEIADFFDRHGASVEISPGLDFVSVSLFCLTKTINQVLPQFIELITSSVFPEEELSLQKEIFNQSLKINNEKTSYVASKLIRRHLFGPSHPYGKSIEEGDVNQLTSNDLRDFFHNDLLLNQVFIVGFLDESILDSIIKQLRIIQPDLRKQKSSTVAISQNELSEHVERPNSIQSSLRLGKRIIDRNHKDYPALILINHIFGGYFGSRLMKNIREDKGLTYGIHSSISNLKHDAFFLIGADVNRINKDIAITEIKKELDILCNKIVETQELQTAKSHLLGSLQLEIANPFSVIDKIKAIHLNRLNENFYNHLFIEILNVDETAIQKVAIDHLSNNLIEVAVG